MLLDKPIVTIAYCIDACKQPKQVTVLIMKTRGAGARRLAIMG